MGGNDSWSRREFAKLTAAGAAGLGAPAWPRQLPGSNITAPPTSASGAALQQAFDAVQASQARAKMRQVWGSTVRFNDSNTTAMPSVSQVLINIGPWETPRAVAMDEQWVSADGSAQSLGELSPGTSGGARLIYRMTIGIGTTTILQVVDRLPSVLFCSSLQVEASRDDSNVGEWFYSAWAGPHIPRSQPLALYTAIYTIGGGTASAFVGGPPNFATHVTASLDAAAATDETLVLQIPIKQSSQYRDAGAPVSGSYRVMLMQRLGATAGASWSQPVVPIPAHCCGTPAILTRFNTVGQQDYAITWLRC